MIEIIKKNKLLAAVSLAYIFLFIAMPDKAEHVPSSVEFEIA